MSYTNTRRPLFDTACRFQDGVTMEILNHGHGVRLQFRRDGAAFASTFLDETDTKLMLNALAQHFGLQAPAPTVGLYRSKMAERAERIEALLVSFRDGIDELIADNPF